MDSESLDRCIQTALSVLYPPFQATSATVLCQVLNVVESCYRGDGLHYLLHFLLPAKQFLQNIQQEACVQYCGLLFRHEGWPLCVHEKVVVQLCPLDQRLLRPGDFYLLVSPAAAPSPRAHSASCKSSICSSPRLLLCSVSVDSCYVEQQEVPEIALRSLFSMAWLDSVNKEREQRGASRLERCLLSANGDVFRVPWEDLVFPQFMSRPPISSKEDKESSDQEREMLIDTHDSCRDTDSNHDVKLLPSSTKSDQSPVSNEGEDSEGEYVELMEFPLPRFSPQKGSLTQSISLQHRARTSTTTHTMTLAHTPANTNAHAAATPHTPAASNTHSSGLCTEATSHTQLCSRLIEENLCQDSCRSVLLTPICPSSSYAPCGASQPEQRTSQELIEGTDSCRSLKLNTEPENCTEQREEEVVQKNRGSKWEMVVERQEGRLIQRNERKHEVVSNDEGVEEGEEVQEKEVELLEEGYRRDGDLFSHLHTAEEEGEMEEEENLSEESEGDVKEEFDEDRGDEAEEVEVDEEVQVIIVQQVPQRREEQQVMNEDAKGSGEEEVSGDGETDEAGSCLHSYTEKNTINTQHSEDSSYENMFEKHTDDSYFESSTVDTHCEDSYSTNSTVQTHCEECYYESSTVKTHEDLYSENNTQHTQLEMPNLPNIHSRDSYCENTLETHTEDAYSENTTVETTAEDSYSEKNVINTLNIHSGDSCCENMLETNTKDSCSESITVETHKEDSYSENNTEHIQLEMSNSPNIHSRDSYCENMLETHTEDTYCESNKACQELSSAMDPDSLWTKPKESENGQQQEQQQDEEEEECSCVEVGEGRAAELQTEGLYSELPPAQFHTCLSAAPTWKGPEPAAASPQLAQSVPIQLPQSHQSSFYSVLLSSGAVCLPGTRDRSGHALLTVSTQNVVWSDPNCDSAELLRLLLYYTSTLREEVRALGQTVLVDARQAAPAPALFSALRSLQENEPGSIHTVLLLLNKDSSLCLDKPAATQVEVLSSLKLVQKHVELHQLPAEFGGSFSFSQSSWLCLRSRIEQLTRQCEDAINLLQKTINILQCTALPAAAEDAEQLLSRYKAVMHSILVDSRLARLQQEGGASLSRLRREESSISVTETYSAEVEAVSSLYDRVDELLHRLVTLSNSRTQELNFIVDFRSVEQSFAEVSSWLDEVGEVRLKSLYEPADSLELLNKQQQDFKDFYTTACSYYNRGEALLGRLEHWDDMTSADLHIYEAKIRSFWARLRDFSQRVTTTGQNVERALRLYRFLDQAYGWALEGMRHLAGINMEDCKLPDKCHAVIGCLEEYQRHHPPIPDARFQEMKVVAGELRGERGLHQWNFAWSKCQETKKMFDRKMEAALRTRDSAFRRRSNSALSRSSTSSRKTLSGLWEVSETSSSSSSCPPEEDADASYQLLTSSSLITSTPAPSSPVTPQHTPLLHRLFRSFSSEESADQVTICSSSSSAASSFNSSPNCTPSSASSRRQQLRKTQSFDCPPNPEVPRWGPCPRALSEPVCRGNTGVFIRGLEVSSTVAADHTLCPRMAARGWARQGPRSPGTPSTTDPRHRGSKLRHIVEEMVTTEREYVRSLRYIIHHYFPEMDRIDLPQDLRGKRSVVFGNLEKLLDFHSQFFLKELEACWKHPLRVPHCFLRHQEQFGLYALYSKNKPKSDSLLASHGNAFFRRKQVELGDKMDLSSYLLKPIQRMSKYALLLTDLMKEVGVAQEAELVALQAATDMVKFQLRHGNDLLAMDAIQDCDVNLKEQGQLIRQDEFTVLTGRKKCQRHVFLFEELILFSKPKKMEGGLDVLTYKHSVKTSDVGLTESTGDSGVRFEIWFRRRTSKNQTFILHAATADVKHAWTSDIARILWTQATRNKEMRLKEMVSMGVGNKPFLDIQPSDAAISDRAVHYIMKSRGARTRASIAVSVFDHSHPFKQATLTSDHAASGPSSSSLLGPLNLHVYSQTRASSPAADSSFVTSCIEEDEQEHETSSQPSMTTESSGSSSRCLSGSTGSDSGCVSSHLQEPLPEEPLPRGQRSSSGKQHLSSHFVSAKAAVVISPATIV